jgi:predicted N-acyltransferase
MSINIIDPTTDSRWDIFVEEQKNGIIFHTSAWARIIEEAYGYKPRYYVLETENSRICAAVPLYLIKSFLTGNRLVCLPFSDSCCPLGKEADIMLILDYVKREISHSRFTYLELRGLPQGIIPSQLGLYRRQNNFLYVLDLSDDVEKLNRSFHDSVRRGIRQAERRGVKIRMSHEKKDLDLFYGLHVVTRKKLGVLPQPYAFFKALYRNVISQNMGFTGLAESEGRIIAGVVYLNYKDTIYYKFNASDECQLKKRPNHLVTWEAIKYACANHLNYFDFGRCSLEEQGLRDFKNRWGTREINLPYYYYPRIQGITSVSENSAWYRAMRLFSHIAPASACELAGSLLYKHLG